MYRITMELVALKLSIKKMNWYSYIRPLYLYGPSLIHI